MFIYVYGKRFIQQMHGHKYQKRPTYNTYMKYVYVYVYIYICIRIYTYICIRKEMHKKDSLPHV